jgi:hypothetical protein
VADIDIRLVQPGDVEALVAKMRQADINELRASGVGEILPRVQASVDRSVLCRTGTADGEVGCIFGVVPVLTLFDQEGSPWMLGTDLVTRHQRVLMRRCRPYIQDMLRIYPHLVNAVHADNHAALRWLKSVGFLLHPAEPFGVDGALFHPFEMRG